MDQLSEAFASAEVSFQPNSTAAEHPHFALYKAKSSSFGQEVRRKKFLEAQKHKRYDYASHARKLATNQWSSEDENNGKDEHDDGNAEEMDFEECIKKPPRSYKDQLMLSEWLVEVPVDLESQWYLTLCPVGKRCLVVSSRGYTKSYAKNGYLLKSFQSNLPGGNKKASSAPLHVYSLLDCIYNVEEKTFYILDIMCWNSHPCFDSETEFRFYWMHAKIAECPGLEEITRSNPHKFIPLPNFNCDTESIRNALWSPLPFLCKLDGLLFYHKKSHYNCGTTPLVGWLKAYMLPEILQIDVPESLTADKPSSYISMQKELPDEFKRHAERKNEEANSMYFEEN